MRVCVLGLGEAGSVIAADLARVGDEVNGYDPAEVPTPEEVVRHAGPAAAVAGCALVMAVTPGAGALAALDGVLASLDERTVYADLSTGSPLLKEQLAEMIAGRGLLFADVALMAPVPGRGITTPAFASGSGAGQYAEMLNARGGNVEVVGDQAGEAATRKLLRSVVMKGLAALLIESMEAAEQVGKSEWLWDHLVAELSSLDPAMLRRLLLETAPHAVRRLEEMTAARELLVQSGSPAPMTTATIAHLERLIGEGMPDLPVD